MSTGPHGRTIDALRQLAPERALKLYRAVKSALRPAQLWNGVYRSFDEVPVKGAGYDSAEWLRTREAAMRALLAAQAGGNPEPIGTRYGLLVSLVAARRPCSRVRIVDFGGGFGQAYAYLRHALPGLRPGELAYTVLETPASCAIGRSLFQDDADVRFQSSEEWPSDGCDVVFVSGTLQYIRDYRATLHRLASLAPDRMLFTLLPAGEIPTFASAQQNLPRSVLPHWFFNVEELCGIMRDCGYSLLMRMPAEEEFSFSNFPPGYRLARMANLLFGRPGPPDAVR